MDNSHKIRIQKLSDMVDRGFDAAPCGRLLEWIKQYQELNSKTYASAEKWKKAKKTNPIFDIYKDY